MMSYNSVRSLGLWPKLPSLSLCFFVGSLLAGLVSVAEVRFTLLKRHEVSRANILEAKDFVVGNDQAYILSTDGFKIHRFSLEANVFQDSTKGFGNGPGEFAAAVASMAWAHGRLFVTTLDMWTHVFDEDLRLLHRKFSVSNLSDFSALGDGAVLACAMSFEEAAKGNAVYGMTILRGDLEGLPKGERFVFRHPMDNLFLSRCWASAGGEYVAYAQTGEAAVYFYGKTGEFQRKVPIDAWKGQIMFMDEPAENPAKAMLKSMGVKDLRTPLGGYINGVHVGETYTLVQGGLTTPQKLRTVALVDHSTWRVHYAELPVLCRSISLKGESFYCLLTREDKVLIEEFAITAGF